MENTPIQNGIYTITYEGKTTFSQTQSFGSLHDVLDLLCTTRKAYEKVDKRHPDENVPEAVRLSQYSQSRVPIVFYQPSLLFQPLNPEGFRFKVQELTDGDERIAHYTINYDKDQFAMTSWDSDGLWTVKAPLGGVIDAYGGAVHRHGRARSFEENVFLRGIEAISSAVRTAEDYFESWQGVEPELQEQKGELPEGPTEFTGPSM